ncbi:MAG: RluA family pseudouridine synthase [Deltaproteobacteria bacterium]|nr:RluA family pseudouridine synthase [Deltaproteobacteria bacterium]
MGGDEERCGDTVHRAASYTNRRVATREFDVEVNYRGWRLDLYLKQKIGRLSRTRIERLIGLGVVTRDGGRARASDRLAGGERIVMSRNIDTAPIAALPILYRDDAIVVIDKPAGVVVHPSARYPGGTIVDWFREQREKVYVVHRLDRETSGVLLLARSRDVARAMIAAFAAREVDKEYRAWVWGDLREARQIDVPLGFEPGGAIRIRMAVAPGGLASLTDVWPIAWAERDGRASTLVRARPKTGRQHQIRVHLASIGHPVVGDTLYGVATPRLREAWEGTEEAGNRLLLHAHRLAFRHPVKAQSIEITAPLPTSFRV